MSTTQVEMVLALNQMMMLPPTHPPMPTNPMPIAINQVQEYKTVDQISVPRKQLCHSSHLM